MMVTRTDRVHSPSLIDEHHHARLPALVDDVGVAHL
jgi:hypothetical protein